MTEAVLEQEKTEEEIEAENTKKMRALIKEHKRKSPIRIKIGDSEIVDLGFLKRQMKNPKRNIPVFKSNVDMEGRWELETEKFFRSDPMGSRIPYNTTVHITPKMAMEIFTKANFRNRRIDMAKIKYYVNLMNAGQWYITHQGISFYDDGSLADGQHRIIAIIWSGISVTLSVSSGLVLPASLAIDYGKRRTTTDIFTINDETDYTRSMQMTARWMTSKKISQKSTEKSPEDLINFCREHHDSLINAENTDTHAVVRAAYAACYEFSLGTDCYDQYNDGDCESRLIELQSILRGESRNNSQEDSSALLVWQKGLNSKTKREFSSGNSQASGYYKSEKAFDCFMRREPLNRLTLSKQDRIERFPFPKDIEVIKSQIE